MEGSINGQYQYDGNGNGNGSGSRVRVTEWIHHELAAIKIQRIVRQWLRSFRCKRIYKTRALSSRGYGRHFFLKKDNPNDLITTTTTNTSYSSPNPIDCIQALINQKAEWKHQTSFWRTIIDIKRSFPKASSDLIVKALFEAQGEISRTLILLGTKEFCLQHRKALPDNIKSLLLPHLQEQEQDQLLTLPINNPLATFITNKTKSGGGGGGGSNEMLAHWAENRRRNVDMVRTLRAQRRQKKHLELIDKLSVVVEKSFFPKEENHNNNNNNHTRPKSSQQKR
eukprot:scaffold4256_cov174-Ochromonas_danica.AAC.3